MRLEPERQHPAPALLENITKHMVQTIYEVVPKDRIHELLENPGRMPEEITTNRGNVMTGYRRINPGLKENQMRQGEEIERYEEITVIVTPQYARMRKLAAQQQR